MRPTGRDQASNPRKRHEVVIPKFLVHIGPHKTGTTYLQASFRRLSAELRARGVHYSANWSDDDSPSQHRLPARLRYRDSSLRQEFAELRSTAASVILLSAEDLSDLPQESIYFLRDLIGEATVEVIFYCRQWAELLFSGWQETLKSGRDWTFPEFTAGHVGNAFGSTVLNHGIKLDCYSSAFGIDALRLVSYSRVKERKEDLFGHFARTFLGWSDAPAIPAVVNASMSRAAAELVRAFNSIAVSRTGTADAALFRLLRDRMDSDPVAELCRLIDLDRRVLKVNEGVPGLSTLHMALVERYGSRLVEPADTFFTPRTHDLSYAGTAYAFDPSANRLIVELYRELAPGAAGG